MGKLTRVLPASMLVLACCSAAGAMTPPPMPPAAEQVAAARRIVGLLGLPPELIGDAVPLRTAIDTWLSAEHPQADDIVRRSFTARVEQRYSAYLDTPDEQTIDLAAERFARYPEGALRDFIGFLETPAGAALAPALADGSVLRERAVRRVSAEFTGLYKAAEESAALLRTVNGADQQAQGRVRTRP